MYGLKPVPFKGDKLAYYREGKRMHRSYNGAMPSSSAGWRRTVLLSSVFLCGAVFALTVAGCHAKPKLTPQQAEGKHLYDVRCAHCHEDNDLALKKVPPDLHGVFNRATLPSGLPATDQIVEREVLSGRGMMPAFAGRFTREQMAALLAWLHTGMRQ